MFKTAIWNYHWFFCFCAASITVINHLRVAFKKKQCLAFKGIQRRRWWSCYQESRSSFRGSLSKWSLLSIMHANFMARAQIQANQFQIPLPDYWDFIRFAFVIGLGIQVPRVQVTSKKMRRVVIVQSILSFILNLSIFMLAITIMVGKYW